MSQETHTCAYIELILYSYGSTRRHYGVYSGISEHILVFRILYVYYRTYTCLTELILVLRNLYWYFGSYTGVSDLILVLRSIYMYFGLYTCITELIHVFQILYMYFRSYTCLTEYILVLRILYLFYRTYYCLTDLILVLQNLLLPYGSYSYAKVPVGTIIRNGSGSYHIQVQIRLLQIRTFVFRRYRSQIHYTEVPVGTTGLILNLQNLYLFSDTRVPVGTTEITQIQEYPWVL